MRGFRVWCKSIGKYIDFGMMISQDGKLLYMDVGHEFQEVPSEDYVDYIVEYPTGLKDKNGKEIYEGDIVEALVDGVWDVGMDDISFGKVKWKLKVIRNEIRFMDIFEVIGSKSSPYRSYHLFDQALSELEVIGNIHENHELLGDTNATNKEEE